MSIRRIVVVGSKGNLGGRLVVHFGCHGCDCRDPNGFAQIKDLLAEADVVINVSGPRAYSGLGPSDYFREHVGPASTIVKAMHPKSHLVHVSSTSVYGAQRCFIDASRVEEPTRFPLPGYACAKLSAETYLRAACAEDRLGLTVLRPSMIYGPGIDSALETIKRKQRQGVRLVLLPKRLRQHLLSSELFFAAIESAITKPPGPRPIILADPFVLINADLTPKHRGRVLTLPLPLNAFRYLRESLLTRMPSLVPYALDTLAGLAVDNEFDFAPAFKALGLDRESFSRSNTFDPYWEAP